MITVTAATGHYGRRVVDELLNRGVPAASMGSAGDGKVSGATRADLAEAAAAVLAGDGHQGRVYELGGTAFTMAGLAAEVSRQTGKHIVYQDMPADAYAKTLTAAGIPESFAGLLADTSLAVAHGDWYTDSTDLPQLIGRPSTPLGDAVAAALKTGLGGLDPRG
jgi:NAD(P)H dehydrogenase (quinone)